MVLAVAGLKRLGLADRITEILEPEMMLPAAAQGALALQTREGDDVTGQAVAMLDHGPSHAEVVAERACLRRMEAGCQAPVGANANVVGDRLTLRAAVVSPAGTVRAETTVESSEAEAAGRRVAEEILDELGVTSLRSFEWAGTPAPSVGETS